MVRIIREEQTAKKYIEEVKRLFDTYKISARFDIKDNYRSKRMSKVLKQIEDNSKNFGGELQTKILKENLLGDKSLSDIAREEQYSLAHMYSLRQKILKEFATIIFEVILVWKWIFIK